MTYICKDCSYRGKTSGQGGGCPACGSFNITGLTSVPGQPKPGRVRLALLIVLWVYLIGLIIWKLQT